MYPLRREGSWHNSALNKVNHLTERYPILFVGHEASRTGAPIALLRFMRWFKENVGWSFSCLLQEGGPLVSDFESLCPTSVLAIDRSLTPSFRNRILRRTGLGRFVDKERLNFLLRHQIKNPALIYCNTIAAWAALELVFNDRSRVLCHVHELEFSFRAIVGPVNSSKMLEHSNRFIACSRSVAKNLERHGVSEDRIDLVHEFVPIVDAEAFNKDEQRRWLREQLGLPGDALIVAGSGTLGWRKGSDLFAQVASFVRQHRPDLNLHFLWLEGPPEP